MSFPESASFPTSIWDGGSSDRSADLDDQPIKDIVRGPSENDWSKIVQETIAIENALATVRTLVGASNTAALATTATSGHHYVPTCAGTPTGVPAAITGFAAIVYDTTAHKLWIYDAGWKTSGAVS
jgi:hypothetical protein